LNQEETINHDALSSTKRKIDQIEKDLKKESQEDTLEKISPIKESVQEDYRKMILIQDDVNINENPLTDRAVKQEEEEKIDQTYFSKLLSKSRTEVS